MNDSLVFPQLKGHPSLSPEVVSHFHHRTVVNELPGACRIVLSDPNSNCTEWLLRYEEVSDTDLSLIVGFFESCRGQLKSFTFCPPQSNLLVWSDRLEDKTWLRDPLLIIEKISDGIYQLTNTSQQRRALEQVAAVPESYEICFGLSVRAKTPCRVRLAVESQVTTVAEQPATNEWQQVWVSHDTTGSTARCRLEIEPGHTIQLRQPFLVPQRYPASYTCTRERSALRPVARFADDTIHVSTIRPNAHLVTLRIRTGKAS